MSIPRASWSRRRCPRTPSRPPPTDTFTASPDTPLTDVVREMAENKYGSVVLVEDERVVGVFTTIDALRTLLSFAKKDRPRAVAARH
jgi:CBS domain-containing protein